MAVNTPKLININSASVCWFRKRSELTFSLLSLGATGEQGISCYSSMALLLLTLASSDLKLPRGCWDTSCHIDDSLFFPLFLCVVCSFVVFFWSKIWWPLLFSSIQADSNLMENTTISSCCKISADEEVRKKKVFLISLFMRIVRDVG